MPSHRADSSRAHVFVLTPREQELYALRQTGLSRPAIARQLGLTLAQVRRSLTEARQKVRLQQDLAADTAQESR